MSGCATVAVCAAPKQHMCMLLEHVGSTTAPLHQHTPAHTSTHQPGCRPNPSLLLRPHKAPPHTICSVAMDRSFMRDSSDSSDGITLIARLVPRGVWTAALAVTAAVLSCAVMMASVVSDRLGYICSYRHTVHHCTACHAHYLPHLLPPPHHTTHTQTHACTQTTTQTPVQMHRCCHLGAQTGWWASSACHGAQRGVMGWTAVWNRRQGRFI